MMGIWKQSLFVSCLTVCGLVVESKAVAGLMVTSTATSVRVDFEQFRGDGFSPAPSSTQLDSDHWRIEGLSEGKGSFGGTYLSGDFARGSSAGGVSSGGIYGFDVGSGNAANWAIGFQPTGSDLTPGAVTLMLTNATGAMVDQVDLGFRLLSRNDGDRSGWIRFAYSLDDRSYEEVGSGRGSMTSPGPADLNPNWVGQDQSLVLSGLGIADGSSLFLRWGMDDASGTGSRDEWALDDVDVRFKAGVATVPEPSGGLVLGVLSLVMLGTGGRGRIVGGRAVGRWRSWRSDPRRRGGESLLG